MITTYPPNKARARTAMALVIAAIATTALAGASIWVQRAVSGGQTMSGKVLPDFAADLPQVRTIEIASKGQKFSLVRRGSAWVMPERGGYKVADAALSDLAKALSELEYKAPRTSDPNQFAKLGVDNPRPDNDDTLVIFKGATNQILSGLHIGQKESALFVRKAGSNDVFEANGNVPEIGNPAKWLDLKVLDVTPENIASVSGTHRGESGYAIVRRPDGGFAPVGGQANVTATTAAIALTKWAPIDVMPASNLVTDPLATHVTTLRDGLVISLTAYDENGRYFAAVSADASKEEASEAATKINQRSDGWAFEVDATQFADISFKKDAIVNGPSITPP
jgi:hypothetical protein